MPKFRPNKVKLRSEIRGKKQELHEIKSDTRATKDRATRIEHRKRQIRLQQEIFQLRSRLRTLRDERAQGELQTGALPDFVIIGASKCGTTSLYGLLTQHPHVEPAAAKELHFFDDLFDEGTEWYRRCFPTPRWKDGRRTITGEATPMLAHGLAPERMAEVVPEARLIVLLRNPVDRAYSLYHHWARNGVEALSFEEVIEAEQEWLHGTSRHECGVGADDVPFEYLSRSVYVDHLQRWSRFFGDEQLLVLKSEDFFELPSETLKRVLNFLELPDWQPDAWKVRNAGTYEENMDSATRHRLEEYFEPHNKRLYEFLSVDFEW